MHNEITLVGYVGQDPSFFTFQDGQKVADFTLATTRRWKGRQGEKQEETSWHRIKVQNDRLVDLTDLFIRAGKLLLVVGRLAYRKWTSKEGTPVTQAEIVVDWGGKIVLLPQKGDKDPLDAPKASAYDEKHKETNSDGQQKDPFDELDDEIPF